MPQTVEPVTAFHRALGNQGVATLSLALREPSRQLSTGYRFASANG